MKLAIDSAPAAFRNRRARRISDAEPPAVTRIVFTPSGPEGARVAERSVRGGRACGARRMRSETLSRAGLGSDPKAPAVGTGSHIDAIPNAGKYDGVVGVLGGLEAIRALQRSGFRPRNSIELLVFTSEEPTRFGIGCLGSRLLSGTLSRGSRRKLKDKDGESVDEVRREGGMRGELRGRQIAGRLLQSIRGIAHRTRSAAGTRTDCRWES